MRWDLTPDFYVHSYADLKPAFFIQNGIRGLLTDVDDTLVLHNSMQIPAPLAEWVDGLRRSGVKILLLSNNSRSRVEPFANRLGVPFLSRALKPLSISVRRACAILNVPPEACILMGDQLFTDVAAARRAGMRSILVDPIGTKSTRFVRLKRRWEEKLRGQLKRMNADGTDC